jgi:hypothetical protein
MTDAREILLGRRLVRDMSIAASSWKGTMSVLISRAVVLRPYNVIFRTS